MARRRAKGDLESEVLASLWATGRPMTVAQVVEVLGGTLAHTTVQTILSRLYEKHAVVREPAGRGHAYTPVLDHAGIAANRMRAMLDRGGDHTAVLTRFLGALTPEDEATVAAVVNRLTVDSDS